MSVFKYVVRNKFQKHPNRKFLGSLSELSPEGTLISVASILVTLPPYHTAHPFFSSSQLNWNAPIELFFCLAPPGLGRGWGEELFTDSQVSCQPCACLILAARLLLKRTGNLGSPNFTQQNFLGRRFFIKAFILPADATRGGWLHSVWKEKAFLWKMTPT